MSKSKFLKKALPQRKRTTTLGRFIWALIVVGILGLGGWGAMYLFSNLPGSSLANVLPAEETMGYIEISDLTLPEKWQASLKEENLEAFLNQLEEIDITAAAKKLANGAMTVALIQTGDQENEVVFLIETGKRAAINYFESLLLEGEKLEKTAGENPIYNFPQGQSYSFKWVDGYIAIAQDELALQKIGNQSDTLAQDEDYLKSINQLPRSAWLKTYLNFEIISLEKMGTLRSLFDPLKSTSKNLAFSIRKENTGLHFNLFVNVNKNLLSLKPADSGGKFTQELSDYLPAENVGLYMGGANLENEWQNTLQTLSNLNPAYSIILEGLLRAQVENIFGQGVDLRNDLYPLFENEYALSFKEGGQNEGPKISLILAHEDKTFAEAKLEKMSEGFKTIAARFAPKIYIATLPDGTQSRELVPDNTQLEEIEEEFAGHSIRCSKIGDKTSFCYTITDHLIVMTNDLDDLKASLDPSQERSLSEDAGFKAALNNLSQVNDEVTFVRFEGLSGIIANQGWTSMLSPLLPHLDSATWVKHYFDNGLSSEGYLLYK